jgi:hypothetical protein
VLVLVLVLVLLLLLLLPLPLLLLLLRAVMPHSMTALKPIILHLGDPIEYNHDIYQRLQSQFDIVHPAPADRQRPAFLRHLREKKWGDFHAIMRPFWNTGGEMGRWDRELIEQLPKSVKVYASAGAGFDWVDTDILAEFGKCVECAFLFFFPFFFFFS